MSKVKSNYEIISDKTQNPVVSSEYVKHGTGWLDTVINQATTALNTKADKSYVDTELAKKSDTSTVSTVSNRVDTIETEQTSLNSRMSAIEAGTTPEGSEVIGIRTGADGSTYETAGDAVRGQINQLRAEDKTAIKKIDDIVHSNALIDTKYIKATGLKSTWRYCDYGFLALPEDAKTIYSNIRSVTPNGGVNPTYLISWTFYNGETQLTSYNQTVMVATFNIPDGATRVFAKFGINGTTAANTEVIYDITVTTNSNIVVSLNNAVKIGDKTVEKTAEIVSNAEKIAGESISSKNLFVSEFKQASINDNGVYGPITSVHNTATDKMIPVQPGMMYTLSWKWNVFVQRLYLYEYDSAGNFIKGTTIDEWTKRINAKSFVTGSTTAFVRFKTYTPDNTTIAQVMFENVQLEVGGRATNAISTVDVSNAVDYEKVRDRRMTIPDYYFANGYLESKVDSIRTLMANASGNYDAFFFISDMHWNLNQQHSPAIIRYLKDRLNIPRLFNGGDMYDKWSQYYIDDCLKCLQSAFGTERNYNVVGNHEYKGPYMTDPIVWMYLNSNKTDIVIGDSGRSYYYVDNNPQKIRYIVLNVYANSSDGEDASLYFEEVQQTWFRDVALNLGSGWKAIVFTHVIKEIANSSNNLVDVNGVTENIYNICDSYNGNGEIVAIIAGHTHRDRITHTPSGIPVIITTCDKNGVWYDPDGLPDICETRESGTISEGAFDVFVVDKRNRKISAVRIGSKAFNGVDNNLGTQVEMRQVNFKSES